MDIMRYKEKTERMKLQPIIQNSNGEYREPSCSLNTCLNKTVGKQKEEPVALRDI